MDSASRSGRSLDATFVETGSAVSAQDHWNCWGGIFSPIYKIITLLVLFCEHDFLSELWCLVRFSVDISTCIFRRTIPKRWVRFWLCARRACSPFCGHSFRRSSTRTRERSSWSTAAIGRRKSANTSTTSTFRTSWVSFVFLFLSESEEHSGRLFCLVLKIANSLS